jgi:integrase
LSRSSSWPRTPGFHPGNRSSNLLRDANFKTTLNAARIVDTKAFLILSLVQNCGTIMRMATPWKHPDSGIYYFRRAIPNELRKKIGKTVIKESLGTREPNEARRLFLDKQTECENLFESARNGFVITQKKATELAGIWLRRKLNEDESQRDLDNPELIFDTNSDTKDLHSYYDHHIEEMQEAREGGNAYRVVKDEINDIAYSENVPVINSIKGFDVLVEELFWAKIRYYQTINKRSDGDWSTDVEEMLKKYPVATNKSQVKAEGITLQELFKKFKAERQPPEKTADEYQKVIARFIEVNGSVSAECITGSMVREFKDALLKNPSVLTHKQRALSLPELIKSVGSNYSGRRLSDGSINKHITMVSTVLKWAGNNSYFDDNWNNPAQGKLVKRKGSKKEIKPFTNQELEKIFSSDAYVSGVVTKGGAGKAAYWLPVISLYTGMRLEEAGQLLVSDIKQEDGVWYFDINESESKRLKNKSSTRIVPVHKRLIDFGLIDYVDSIKDVRLFPLLKADKYGSLTQNWSKWFGRLLTKLNIKDSSKVYHSFRHGMKDALRNAGVDEAISDAITGHTNSSVGRTYGSGYNLATLNKAIQKVNYDVDAFKMHW